MADTHQPAAGGGAVLNRVHGAARGGASRAPSSTQVIISPGKKAVAEEKVGCHEGGG